MSDELDTLEIEVSAQLLEKTEAYMDLAGWDANEIVTHALTTLFKVAESRNFPPTIPDACLALGKLIRAGRREGSDDEGSSASTDRLGKERQKGKTFRPPLGWLRKKRIRMERRRVRVLKTPRHLDKLDVFHPVLRCEQVGLATFG